MVWMPLGNRLEQLPLLLSGPVLRRTEPAAVTVWVALKTACVVTLQVYATQAQGHQLDRMVLSGTRSTIAIGQHLHLVAVTATPLEHASGGDRLLSGSIYAYDLHFSEVGAVGQESDPKPFRTLLQAIQPAAEANDSISYFQHQLPTFALPPTDLNHLKIVHGSCRKPHGGGKDVLPILDQLLERSSHDPNARPHQLFLTGDQIYGDDVADPWLWLLTDVGDTLLGWQQSLPLNGTLVTAKQLLPGQRSQLVETQAGLTAGLRNKPEYAKSHLLSFGEYCAAYLLTWSPVLHPSLIPDRPPHDSSPHSLPQQPKSKGQKSHQWHHEAKALRDFGQRLWRVRRALANISTYTICDDHDISDDWYLNQAWCLRVLGKPLGRRVVQNGLQAYALFQAWGNTPQQFEAARSGETLLQAIATWSAAQGTHDQADRAIARLLGLPPSDPHTQLPQFQPDGDVLILDRDAAALEWHYTVRGDRHEVIVLDTRTWRGYPASQPPKAPPMLLSPTAFKQQLTLPMQLSDRLNQAGTAHIELTLVIAPTNLMHMRAIDWVQRWNLRQGKVYNNDVGDAWNIHQGAFSALLSVLFQARDRIVVLSGDIHYGYATRLNYGSLDAPETPHTLVQLTSSAFKNAEWKTQVVHTKIKAIAPEPVQYWVGWHTTPALREQPTLTDSSNLTPRAVTELAASEEPIVKQIHSSWGTSKTATIAALYQSQTPPDWHYRLEWIKRQPAQVAFNFAMPLVKSQLSKSQLSNPQPQGLVARFLRMISWIWRNRWFQEGNEVVGHNNLGVVQFRWRESKTAVQSLYWLAPWKPNQVVVSRFEVTMEEERGVKKKNEA